MKPFTLWTLLAFNGEIETQDNVRRRLEDGRIWPFSSGSYYNWQCSSGFSVEIDENTTIFVYYQKVDGESAIGIETIQRKTPKQIDQYLPIHLEWQDHHDKCLNEGVIPQMIGLRMETFETIRRFIEMCHWDRHPDYIGYQIS